MNSSCANLRSWLRRHRARLLAVVFGPLVLSAVLLLWADHACRSAAAGRIFRSPETVPFNDVALVLGTGKTTARGNPNLHFNQRIAAAAALYHAGKVRHLLVSGDNHIAGYDEPTDMLDALAAAGVPTNAITCD